MNEALTKNIIQLKLTTAEKILDQLPTETSNKVKDLGRIILESIDEYSREIKDKPVSKTKSKDTLNNITIE